ncbi:Odorant receptor 71a [Carabus blaptoides fortunei]
MEDFIKVPKFFCRSMGVWPIARSKWSWIYYLHSIIVAYSISYVFLISLTIDIYLSLGDLGVVADASYFFMTELTFITKFMIFTFKRSKFVRLLEYIEDPIFSSHLPEQEMFLKYWSKIANYYSRIFFFMCFMCNPFYGVFPLIDKDEDNILPFRGWFPFDVKHNYLNRSLVYMFQLIGLSIAIAVNASLDVLPTIFMNIGCAQIEILKNNLENASIKAEKLETNKSFVENLEFTLKMKQQLGDNFSEPLSKEADDIVPAKSLKFLAIVWYLLAVMFQISCYCWNGHQVIVQSSGIGESCYNMDWYRCSIRVRKTIFIIMERCKKPIQMTAGNFFVLSIETLTAGYEEGWLESLNANQTELLICVYSSKDFLGPRPNPIAAPPSIPAPRLMTYL